MSSTTILALGAPTLGGVRRLSGRLRKNLAPGWPLAMLFGGYPLWWLLGVSQLMFLVAAAVMALQLARRRHVLVPALFGLWLLFLMWTLTGPFVAQIVAPGADAAVEMTRYFTWAYRMTFFVVATVTVMYVCTLRLTADRVGRILAVMFMVVVGGGWLGVVAPHLSFPSVTELLLPHRVVGVPFIYDQVHPTPAELQNYLGDETARPSAPFSYANAWGLNYATLLPFFVRSWIAGKTRRRRAGGFLMLLFSVVPVIYSLDRGLWAALAVMALFVAVRGALIGHVRLLTGLLLGLVLVTLMVLGTPLRGMIQERFTGHNSNEGRANLGGLALIDTAKTSPIVGFGATRRVQGSFHSIAEGATATCPLCTPPALGTQGQLWTVIFAFGIAGALCFVSFFLYQFIRNLGRRAPEDEMSLTVLLVFLVTMPIYDFSYPALVAVMAAVALLNPDRTDGRRRTWAYYALFARGHWRVLAMFAVAGAAAGGVYQYLAPQNYQATVSLQIPLNRVEPGQAGRLFTLDEMAQIAQGDRVTSAVARLMDYSDAEVVRDISVSATPNTRILHLTFAADSAARARAGARAWAITVLDQRADRLIDDRQREIRSLNARSAQLAASLHEVKVVERLTERNPAVESTLEQDMEARSVGVATEQVAAETSPIDPGLQLGPISVKHDLDGVMIRMDSGAILGFLGGVLTARWWTPRRRLGAVASPRVGDTRLLARVQACHGEMESCSSSRGVKHLVARQRPAACLSIDGRPESEHLAATLHEECVSVQTAECANPGSVVVVASADTRVGHAMRRLDHLAGASIEVTGLVLIRSRPSPRWRVAPFAPSGPRGSHGCLKATSDQ